MNLYANGCDVLGEDKGETASKVVSFLSELTQGANRVFNPAERKRAEAEAKAQQDYAAIQNQSKPEESSVLGPVLVGLGALALGFVGWKLISKRRLLGVK